MDGASFRTTTLWLFIFKLFFIIILSDAYQQDYLCNNGTNFTCVCYKGDKSLVNSYPDCKTFIGSPTLPVIKLSVEMASNENNMNYEKYFKPKNIASLVTYYCMNGTHNCLGTTLPIQEANVIVLNLISNGDRKSTIYYTVAKPRQAQKLTIDTTLEPEKIIHVLNVTLEKNPNLSLFGQAKIIEHTPAEITIDGAIKIKNGSSDHFHENIVFFIFLIVLGLIVGLIYIVAIAKVIRDHKRQSETRKNERNKKAETNTTTTPNYGTIVASEQIRINRVEPEHTTTITYTMSEPQQDRSLFISPLRVGDIDAYEAAEPEHQSQSSLYTYFNDNFQISNILKSTSIYNFVSKRNRSGIKKSKSDHHKISEEPVILRKPDFDDLKKFYTVFRYKVSPDNDNKTVVVKNLNNPRIMVDDGQVVSEGFRDETQEITEDTSCNNEFIKDTNDFANFDYFMINSEGVNGNDAIYDWPAASIDLNLNSVDMPTKFVDNSKNSLRAEDMLTTSYTEENLIKSEVSSIADSNSESESDDNVSEHLLQPISDYQQLRESNWSISKMNED